MKFAPVHTGVQCVAKMLVPKKGGWGAEVAQVVWELNCPRPTGSVLGLASQAGRHANPFLARPRALEGPLRAATGQGGLGWYADRGSTVAMVCLPEPSVCWWHSCLPLRQQGHRCTLVFFSDPEQQLACSVVDPGGSTASLHTSSRDPPVRPGNRT